MDVTIDCHMSGGWATTTGGIQYLLPVVCHCTDMIAIPTAMLSSGSSTVQLESGRYLLHLENGHTPLCATIGVEDKGDVCVIDGKRSWKCTKDRFMDMMYQAIDFKTMVVFKLQSPESDDAMESVKRQAPDGRVPKRKPVGSINEDANPALPADELLQWLKAEVETYYQMALIAKVYNMHENDEAHPEEAHDSQPIQFHSAGEPRRYEYTPSLF